MTIATQASALFQPLPLPGGQTIPNRIAKAAMEENMADVGQLPGDAIIGLYRRWAKGGAGMILTGNVMIAADAMTGPGGIVLDSEQPLEPFRRWAQAGTSGEGRLWMQINHPGRQVMVATNPEALAPSEVQVDIEGFSKLFPLPRAMTEADITRVIDQFATTAARAEEAGFDGVQIHAAHGYLLSQFLSPLTNRRSDQWGGSLENRARLLIEVVKAVRARVSPYFGVGVKLNSADFQKGGFEAEDAIAVVQMLNNLPVDLVEISGGSYESPAMHGAPQKASTRAREAYFVDFARDIVAVAKMPIMVTGGVRRRAIAEDALASEDGRAGVAMVGIAQAMAIDPDLPNHWKAEERVIDLPQVNWKKQGLAGLARMPLTKLQLRRMGAGQSPVPNASPFWTLVKDQIRTRRRNKIYRRWITARETAI